MAVECPAHCSRWARDYMGYCLCSSNDAMSFGLGMVSVVAWVVAEIPQIITNYKMKTGEGLSFVFLFTWILGDLFNLSGCMLQTETLPTQFYTALLYTLTTLTLAAQTIYYDHIYQRLKSRQILQESAPTGVRERLISRDNNRLRPGSAVLENENIKSSPIPLPGVPQSYSAGRESYYMSARSLTTSHTPPKVSLWAPRTNNFVDMENDVKGPLLLPTKVVLPSNLRTSLCVVSLVTFVCGNYGLARVQRTSPPNMVFDITNQLGRKLLQDSSQQSTGAAHGEYGSIGTCLGWAMAVIYMGGRLPQICLNIRRGHADGLNPLMFVFALLGNGTYVASILVSSLKWVKLQPNLPWLVESGGCVLLDTFILFQFMYFRHLASKIHLRKQEVDPE